MLTNKD